MGHRLHFATEYKVEWGGGVCNRCQKEFNEFLWHLCGHEWAWANNDDVAYADEFEIDKDVLKSAIERLNEYTDEELPVELQDRMYTVGEIYTLLNRFIDFSEPNDNFVHFSWF